MHAYVYKSPRRADTFVYLAQRDAFHVLPAALAGQLGALQFVLEVELVEGRRLAQVDAARVRSELQACGFFMQVPASVTSLMARHYD